MINRGWPVRRAVFAAVMHNVGQSKSLDVKIR